MTAFEDVHEFQTVAENARAAVPTVEVHEEHFAMKLAASTLGDAAMFAEVAASSCPSPEWRRIRLLLEEVYETVDAILAGDVVETADGFADIIYIANGGADDFGIPLDKVHAVVHRTNMAKFPGGVKTTDGAGKILKPNNWTGPTEDIKAILREAGWQG